MEQNYTAGNWKSVQKWLAIRNSIFIIYQLIDDRIFFFYIFSYEDRLETLCSATKLDLQYCTESSDHLRTVHFWMANHRQGQWSRDQVISDRIGPANTLQDLHRMRSLRMRVIVHTVCRPIRGGASDSSDAKEFNLNFHLVGLGRVLIIRLIFI